MEEKGLLNQPHACDLLPHACGLLPLAKNLEVHKAVCTSSRKYFESKNVDNFFKSPEGRPLDEPGGKRERERGSKVSQNEANHYHSFLLLTFFLSFFHSFFLSFFLWLYNSQLISIISIIF